MILWCTRFVVVAAVCGPLYTDQVTYSFFSNNSLVADSETIGMSTLTQMSMQREQMQIASDNMNETVNLTAQARQILKKM